MADINAALAASKEAVDQLIVMGETTGPAWTASRAPGKWSPSQIVEHVARTLEESANMTAGRPSKFPKLPVVLHPVVRGLLIHASSEEGGISEGEDEQGDGSSERTCDTGGGTRSP